MVFYIKPSKCRALSPSVYLGGSLLKQVDQHKYLGVFFDPQLKWDVHVAAVCKRMSYYLAIPYNLPSSTITISYYQDVDGCSCIVPVLCFACMGTFSDDCSGISVATLLQLCCSDDLWITEIWSGFGCLPQPLMNLLVQYRALALMNHHYTHDNCVQLDPPLQFGSIHSYDT